MKAPGDTPRTADLPVNKPTRFPMALSDLRGFARLGVDATVGITDLVEAVHHSIETKWGVADAASGGRTSGITGFVYRRVRGVTRLVGHGLDAALGVLSDRVLPAPDDAVVAEQREAVRSAVNGLWGDHLADSGNPLALRLVVGQTHVYALDQVLANLRAAQGQRAEQLYQYIYWQAWHNLEPTAQQTLLLMPLVTESGGDLAYLAEMATELDASRLLVARAAHLRDTRGERVTSQAAMAKMYATESAQTIIDKAVQLHGGLGVLEGSEVEKLYREIRPLRIYEGTTEIQKLVISRALLSDEKRSS